MVISRKNHKKKHRKSKTKRNSKTKVRNSKTKVQNKRKLRKYTKRNKKAGVLTLQPSHFTVTAPYKTNETSYFPIDKMKDFDLSEWGNRTKTEVDKITDSVISYMDEIEAELGLEGIILGAGGFIASVTKKIKDSADYRENELVPGQKISYHGGFGSKYLKHFGIYAGNGMVYELAPQTENKKSRFLVIIAKGLSTLQDFMKRANSKNSPIYKYENEQDFNPKIIRERMVRMKNVAKEAQQQQFILYGNCESLANLIHNGNYTTRQGQLGSFFTTTVLYAVWKGSKYVLSKDSKFKKQWFARIKKNRKTVSCPCEWDSWVSKNPIYCNIKQELCPQSDLFHERKTDAEDDDVYKRKYGDSVHKSILKYDKKQGWE